MSLQDKVVLITGGSKGIGRAVALRVAKGGARVVINYSRVAAAAEEVVSLINGGDGDRAVAVRADASSAAAVASLVDTAVARFGRLDVVFACAATMPMAGLAGTSEEAFDRTYALNVRGPFFLAQSAAPRLADGGRIIFVSTGVARASAVAPPYLLYASTKGAVEQMARVMAKDPALAARGITVNAVAPGPTATDLFMEGKSDALVGTISSWSPFNRLGAPAEIADVVAFIAGPESAWISGQIIGVNGAAFV